MAKKKDDDNVVELKPAKPEKKPRPLTLKQEAFVRAMLKGSSTYIEAYRTAYDAEGMTADAQSTAAWRLMQDARIERRLSDGFKAKAAVATHSGASLRLKLEKELTKIIDSKTEPQSIRLKAMDMLARSDKAAFYLERTTEVTEALSEDEVLDQLKVKLDKAFGAKTG